MGHIAHLARAALVVLYPTTDHGLLLLIQHRRTARCFSAGPGLPASPPYQCMVRPSSAGCCPCSPNRQATHDRRIGGYDARRFTRNLSSRHPTIPLWLRSTPRNDKWLSIQRPLLYFVPLLLGVCSFLQPFAVAPDWFSPIGRGTRHVQLEDSAWVQRFWRAPSHWHARARPPTQPSERSPMGQERQQSW